jgi:hypothetical protein
MKTLEFWLAEANGFEDYKIQKPGRDFFKIGKVRCYWQELLIGCTHIYLSGFSYFVARTGRRWSQG